MRGWRTTSGSMSGRRGRPCCRLVPHFGVDEPEPEPPAPPEPPEEEPPEEEPPELAPLPPVPEPPEDPLDPPPLSLLPGAAGVAGVVDGDDPLEEDASPPLFFGDEE